MEIKIERGTWVIKAIKEFIDYISNLPLDKNLRLTSDVEIRTEYRKD